MSQKTAVGGPQSGEKSVSLSERDTELVSPRRRLGRGQVFETRAQLPSGLFHPQPLDLELLY